MQTQEKFTELRSKMIDHLEAALALADETRDGMAGYLIESALDAVRAQLWPGNLDMLPPRPRNSR
jgi:uncharacterized phage-like protein YoqJ